MQSSVTRVWNSPASRAEHRELLDLICGLDLKSLPKVESVSVNILLPR
jgi:hypothetical protein